MAIERTAAWEWIERGKHLPGPLRDFHDQKDVFKAVEAVLGPCKMHGERVSWVMGHVYTIDRFLTFMALHGWTLQRSRAAVDFADLSATIERRREEEIGSLRAMFRATHPTDRSESDG